MLFVTARDDEVDRILGLEMGADDYVTKPFSPRELVARVRTVLRRAGPRAGAEEVLRVGLVEVAVDRRRVRAGRVEVELTSTEFDLLAHLMRSPGRVFSPGAAAQRGVGVHGRRPAPAPWTCTSLRCAPSSARPARSARCAASATRRRRDEHARRARRSRPADPSTARPRGSLARRVTVSCLLVALVAVGVAALVALRLVSITGRQVTAEVLAQQADVHRRAAGRPATGPVRAAIGTRGVVAVLRARASRSPSWAGGAARARRPDHRRRAAQAGADRALRGTPVSAVVEVDGSDLPGGGPAGALRGVRAGPRGRRRAAGPRGGAPQHRVRGAGRGGDGAAGRRRRRHPAGPAAAAHRGRGAPAARRAAGRPGAAAGTERGRRGGRRGERAGRRAGPQRGAAAGFPAVGVARAAHPAHRDPRLRGVVGRRRGRRDRRGRRPAGSSWPRRSGWTGWSAT